MSDKNSAISLYKRLSSLFKSGPIVKRKIKNIRAPSASTALDLFRKSQRHTYGNVINSYGSYDRMSRYSDVCFHPDTLVYTVDGIFTIKELSERYRPGERFHVYSYDHEKRCVTIGTAHDPRIAKEGKESELVRVTFDDGGHVTTTPDHNFMLRDGSYVEASSLTPGQSLMPFYVKDLAGDGYRSIYTLDRSTSSGWESLHRFNVSRLIRPLIENEVVHHVNFDPSDNSISNLRIMHQHDHAKYHSQLNNKNKFDVCNDSHSKWMSKNNPSKRYDITFERILDIAVSVDFNKGRVVELLDVDNNVLNRRLRVAGFKDWPDFSARRTDAQAALTHAGIVREMRSPELHEILDNAPGCKTIYELSSILGCSDTIIRRRLKRTEFKTWSGLKEHLGTGKRFDYTGSADDRFDADLSFQDVYDAYKPGMSAADIAEMIGSTTNKVVGRVLSAGFSSFSEWTSSYQNHKVLSVQRLSEKSIVYNVTVEKHHNLAVGSLNPSCDTSAGAKSRFHSMVFVKNCEMEYCLDANTRIPICGGGYKTIKELSEEYGMDKEFIVYAYDHNKGQIVPALAKQARQTRTDVALKVTFDSGKTIIGTPNHKLMLRDGTYKRIDELLPGDSMMPFYRKDLFDSKKGDDGPGYRYVYTMDREDSTAHNGWIPEHRLIAEWAACKKLTDDEVVHHMNFKKSDNRPENLRIMKKADHYAYHAKIINGKKWAPENSAWIEEFKKNHSTWMRENNPARRNDITFGRILEFCEANSFNLPLVSRAFDTSFDVIKRRLHENGFKDFETFARVYKSDWRNGGWDNAGEKNPRYKYDVTYQTVCSKYRSGMTLAGISEACGVSSSVIQRRVKWAGFKSFKEFRDSYLNHKVVSVEPHGVIPLYDMTVDGYKNFATDSVISHNTPEVSSALDIYADETCSQDEKGRSLHIYSENPKIKRLLEELFYDTLNTEFNVRSWVRNLPVRWNTRIPLLDGRNVTIKQLAEEFDTGKENWVYSVQSGTSCIVPGKVKWCGLTRKSSPLMRTWLDDGSYVDTTPDHEFILRDGTSQRADRLEPDTSLMPFYRKSSGRARGDSLDGYEQVYDPASNKYVYTHRRVGEILKKEHLFGRKPRKLRKSRLSGVPSIQNHKVTKTEMLNETDDVYCMEVMGPGDEHDRHNFMVLSEGSNSLTSGVCLSNCKYGDFFLFLDISPEFGIINVFPMPVNEVEREEGFDPSDPLAFRFRWVTQGNQVLENWQVAHLRLLGNDAFLPYGSSVIEPARRVWRQLILIEDAMLVYRVVRSPERRVFYIDVGNIPPEDVPNYLEQARTRLKTNQVVDRTSGRVDLRYNPLCFQGVTRIPLLDGRTITIKELVDEWDAGKRDQETYSLDLEKGGTVVPGKLIWAGRSGTTSQFAKITLDDGGVLQVTPDHKMMLRDGNPIAAKDLKPGDSLMPNYTSYADMFGKCTDERMMYESIYVPAFDKYVHTHRLVAAAKYDIKIYEDGSLRRSNQVVHHQNFNKRDNSTKNLLLMDVHDHSKLHGLVGSKNLIAYNKSEKKRQRTSELNVQRNSVAAMAQYNGSVLHAQHNEARSHAMKRMWDDKNRRKRTTANMSYKFDPTCVQLCVNVLRTTDKFIGAQKFCELLQNNAEFLAYFAKLNEHLARDPMKAVNKTSFTGFLKRSGFKDYRSFVAANRPSLLGRKLTNNVVPPAGKVTNHKVVSVEIVEVEEDVYNVTVDKYHNLAVQCPNKEGTVEGKVQSYQSVDEDYFIPVRGSETGTKIDTLPGGTNVTAIEDVEYIQKKLFAALKVPKAYLGYDEMLCLSKDQRIQLVKGYSRSIEDIASDCSAGKLGDEYVWSIDDAGNIVPSKIVRAWQTKFVDELYHVRLDSGTTIKCTGNHPFLCRDGVYRRADELAAGQSLMPIYRKLSSRAERDFQDGYEKLQSNVTGEWEFAHRIVAKHGNITKHESVEVEGKYIIHHVDCDKRNNTPANLMKMGKRAHAIYHSRFASNLLLESSRDRLRDVMKTDSYKKIHREGVARAWARDDGTRSASVAATNIKFKRSKVTIEQLAAVAKCSTSVTEFVDRSAAELNIKKTGISNIIKRAGFNVRAWIRSNVSRPPGCSFDELVVYCRMKNVLSAQHFRKLPRPSDCPVNSKQLHELLLKNGYKYWHQFSKQYLTYNHGVVSIDIVKLDVPEPVYDIEIEGTHNFGIVADGSDMPSLIVVHNSSKSTLSQEDIRFSRTISTIQRTVLSELNKLATIHLFAHGFDGDDLLNFDLQLSNPSTIAQQQKIELYRTKFEVLGTAPEGMFSRDYLRGMIMDMTDDEIRRVEQQKELDKLIDLKLETMKPPQEQAEQAEAEDAGPGGMPDIFAPTSGAPGTEPGGDEEAPVAAGPGSEEEEPEEAADEEDSKLLTSTDDAGDDKGTVRLEKDGAPIKPSALSTSLYNRSRRRHHGPAKMHMPDFGEMVAHDNEALNDIDDVESISGKLESRSLIGSVFGTTSVAEAQQDRPARLSKGVTSIIDTLRQKWGRAKSMLMEQDDASSAMLEEIKKLTDEEDDGSGSGG